MDIVKKVVKQKINSANSVLRQQISVNRKKTVGTVDEVKIVLKSHWACKIKKMEKQTCVDTGIQVRSLY